MYAIYGMHSSCNHGYYCIGVMTSLVACWIRDSFRFGDRIRIRSDSARVGFVSALLQTLHECKLALDGLPASFFFFCTCISMVTTVHFYHSVV